MNTLSVVFLLGLGRLVSHGRKPEIPEDGIFPFVVYFESRSRGMCVGSLVSRLVVLTAAVCVAGPNGELHDMRPINVVTGTRYRHFSRGNRMQVIKVLMPKLPDTEARWYVLQKSVALLLLHQSRVPDELTEQPLRAISIDYTGDDHPTMQDECVMIGWHFFYAQDKTHPAEWWLLHRHVRYQVLQVVDTQAACGQLVQTYEKYADEVKENGVEDDVMCLKDPNNTAQPCHGMYGAPLVCAKGRVVGLLSAPSVQWGGCDQQSILVHKLSSRRNKDFLECAKKFFEPEHLIKWELIMNKTNRKKKKIGSGERSPEL